MGKNRILLLTIVLAGVAMLSLGSIIFPTHNSSELLTFAPTPFPTVTKPEGYTVTQINDIASQTSRNIEVLSPLTDDKVKSGFVVKGNARTKDNSVAIRLSDSDGNIIKETTTMADSFSAGSYGPFEKIVAFNSKAKSGQLDVFQFNKNDGTISDMVSIPLTFR